MTLHQQLRSSVRVWFIIALALFVAAWFVPGGKGPDARFGDMWVDFFRYDYIGSTIEMLVALGLYSLLFAVPSAVVGWVLQFPICMALNYFRREKNADKSR